MPCPTEQHHGMSDYLLTETALSPPQTWKHSLVIYKATSLESTWPLLMTGDLKVVAASFATCLSFS